MEQHTCDKIEDNFTIYHYKDKPWNIYDELNDTYTPRITHCPWCGVRLE